MANEPRTKQLSITGVDLVKNDSGELTGEIKAVIAEMDQIDLDGDILAPGSVGRQDVTVSAYNHGSWYGSGEPAFMPIGKGEVHEAVNQHGKRVVFDGKLFTDMEGARETLKLLKNMGEHQEWSFSLHNVQGESIERDGRRAFLIKGVEVHEVSPVLKGASIGSRTLSVKRGKDAEIERLRKALDSKDQMIADLQRKLADVQNTSVNHLRRQIMEE